MRVNNKRLIVIGDRVLIRPQKPEDRTQVGLYLPQTVIEKEKVASGRIVSTGPGIPVPGPVEMEAETWKESPPQSHYIPMQASPGDIALYLRKEAVEIQIEGETYVIVPQGALLALIREEDGDEPRGLPADDAVLPFE